jgi:hypothetical protein
MLPGCPASRSFQTSNPSERTGMPAPPSFSTPTCSTRRCGLCSKQGSPRAMAAAGPRAAATAAPRVAVWTVTRTEETRAARAATVLTRTAGQLARGLTRLELGRIAGSRTHLRVRRSLLCIGTDGALRASSLHDRAARPRIRAAGQAGWPAARRAWSARRARRRPYSQRRGAQLRPGLLASSSSSSSRIWHSPGSSRGRRRCLMTCVRKAGSILPRLVQWMPLLLPPPLLPPPLRQLPLPRPRDSRGKLPMAGPAMHQPAGAAARQPRCRRRRRRRHHARRRRRDPTALRRRPHRLCWRRR